VRFPDRLESLSYSGLPSAVCIRLFVPHSLTVRFPDRLESLSYSGLPSAVRGRDSPFVDGLL
ncbi:MAG: hypothetical protein J7555_06360, partial [Chloroflexi bacterium]|nr:hypothetical protein [Chloroflexota bacterium]